VVTEFPVLSAPGLLADIAAGSDGNLWFTEFDANRIGRITTAGVVTEFPLPNPGSGPSGIIPGPDGALWFTELLGNRIGRITTGQSAVVPTLTLPMLLLLGFALAGTAMFLMRRP
jgi:virginiamycin B lyase